MPKWGWGKLENGGIRICECGEITLEDEMHVCTLGDKVTDNPIDKIEDTKAWIDFGRMAYFAFSGAIDEGATHQEAFWCVVAYFAGMNIGAANPMPKDENEETPSS